MHLQRINFDFGRGPLPGKEGNQVCTQGRFFDITTPPNTTQELQFQIS